MHLKSLELFGFKSFAEKTTFEFHRGISGIVGPNGCGKSNVVDAVRWVLGETSARALRGDEMTDVIFNGTDKRKAQGMAEVTLLLADCEETLKVPFNEVAVTRRVFRDGKSEYRINGTIVRLRDVQELFMDTGIGRSSYSIMEQGKIDMLLSSKPEDRRLVFEEAAGITKFRKEKKESLRKLDHTDANLLRVSDVLGEQEKRIGSLRRQAGKARIFQRLSGDIRVFDCHVAHRKFELLSEQRARLADSTQLFSVDYENLAKETEDAEARLCATREHLQLVENQVTTSRQEINDRSRATESAASRIQFNKERALELDLRVAQNQHDIEQTRGKLLTQENILSLAHDSMSGQREKLHLLENSLREEDEKSMISRARRASASQLSEKLQHEFLEKKGLVSSIQAKLEAASGQHETGSYRAKQLIEEEKEIAETLARVQEQKAQFSSKIPELSELGQQLQAQQQVAEHQLNTKKEKVAAERLAANELHKELLKASSRLEVVKQLISNGEELPKATQFVLQGLNEPERFSGGILGVFGSFLEVAPEFSKAIEACLGELLQSVVIKDSARLFEIADQLLKTGVGQAKLTGLDWHESDETSTQEPVPEGAVGWAVSLVRAKEEVAPFLRKALDKVLVVNDLESALDLRKNHPGMTFVAKSGELILAKGVLEVGRSLNENAQKGSALIERQNEIRKLESEVIHFEQLEKEKTQLISRLESALNSAQEFFAETKQLIYNQSVEISSAKEKLGLISREAEQLFAKKIAVERERAQLVERENLAIKEHKEMLARLLDERGQILELEENLRNSKLDLEELIELESLAAERLNEIKTTLAVEKRAQTSAEEQHAPIKILLEELRAFMSRKQLEIGEFNGKSGMLSEEASRLSAEMEESKNHAKQLELILKEKDTEREELCQQVKSCEQLLSGSRKKLAKISEQRGKEEIEIAKLDLRKESLYDAIFERYQIGIESFVPNLSTLRFCFQKNLSQQKEVEEGEFLDGFETMPEEVVPAESSESIGNQSAGIDFSDDDWEKIEQLLSKLKQRLDSIGPVNIESISEYEELAGRYQFLRRQHDDLVKSKTELLAVIQRINEETTRRFSETFSLVQENFSEMFKELFGSSAFASLELVDPENPLESGIEIIAKPPGKKLRSISLMSGGERSLTAVALLFAIYMIKPSPFCILDELDAPLDESNIGRFLRVLDRFVSKSQFIIVTHSKRTMARADVMYGVTMEELGVSKPVGMRLTSADTEKPEAKTPAQKAAEQLDA